ncbi:MAG: PQQ-like beta-propeller repeat protein [Pirellulaceae bacterium]|nr:PQQ-like beta-propeller repeat protein [Pirellulaceae bacterium]
MRHFWVLLVWLSVAALAGGDELDPLDQWPQWRGPLSTGLAPRAQPPLEWSETKNIRWKQPVVGRGHSTPIVWGQRIFLTAAAPHGEEMDPAPETAPGAHDNLPVTHRHRFLVIALSRKTGDVLWEKEVNETLPHEGGHYTGSLASHSPTTDGEFIFAHFGSHGLYCLDFSGDLVWKRDFGRMQTRHAHGEGSTPVLHGDAVIVNWDHEGQSFVGAYNKRTGKRIWKQQREEVTSWSSPIVADVGESQQLIISGTSRVRGYDPTTGKVIWECGGLSRNIVASPVAADGLLFAGSSYDKQAMLAIRLAGARGDITETRNVIWSRTRGTPYVPSPLLYGKSLYFLRHYQGVLSRVETSTGRELHGAPFRLGRIRNVYSSPVAAAKRIYVTDRFGVTQVLSHDEDPRSLAANQLNDVFNASAALVGEAIFLRGERALYCIAAE